MSGWNSIDRVGLSIKDVLFARNASELVDKPLIKYRSFRNSDPPQLSRVWHESNLGPSAAVDFPADVFDLFVLAVPFFDPAGLIIAESEDSGQIVGFIHAGFAPNESESHLDKSQGTFAALVVHPEYRRQKIGTQLVAAAEAYLARSGATQVVAGAGLDKNGFYNGIYGGLQASGFAHSSAAWNEFFLPLGYQPSDSTAVLHRDLSSGRDKMSARAIKHRRKTQLQAVEAAYGSSWWWHARFGQLESISFSLKVKSTEELVAAGQIHSLDVFTPRWGIRAVGIHNVFVPDRYRRHGYGEALLYEVGKQLRQQSIHLMEAQVGTQNQAAVDLFQQVGFEQVQELVTFSKELAG